MRRLWQRVIEGPHRGGRACEWGAAVLVLEPSQGLDGKLKTARKGVGDYTVNRKGSRGARWSRLSERRQRD